MKENMKFIYKNTTDESFQQIVEDMRAYNGQEKIEFDLSHSKLTEKSHSLLAELVKIKHLRSLTLKGSRLSAGTWEILGESLPESALEEIDIENNNLQDLGVTLLLKNLAHHKTLKVINLCNNNINDTGAISIALVLKNNPNIEKMNLGYNRIGEIGTKQLSDALRTHQSLTHFIISGNPLGMMGAFAIAKSLIRHPSLKILDLYNTHIKGDGIRLIAIAAANNKVLEELNLGANEMYNDATATKEICRMMSSNITLTKLDLSENGIGDLSATMLAISLNNNAKIFLNLSSNCINNSTLSLFNNNKSRVNYSYNDLVDDELLNQTTNASSSTQNNSQQITSQPPARSTSYYQNKVTPQERKEVSIVDKKNSATKVHSKTVYPAANFSST